MLFQNQLVDNWGDRNKRIYWSNLTQDPGDFEAFYFLS
jgi:hypothetical protein